MYAQRVASSLSRAYAKQHLNHVFTKISVRRYVKSPFISRTRARSMSLSPTLSSQHIFILQGLAGISVLYLGVISN